jgi:outer membrane immunogenic protein
MRRSSIVTLIAAGLGACIAHAASAADLPVAPPRVAAKAPVLVPAYSWAGFYVGINAGGAWGRSHHPTSTVFSPDGYFAIDSAAAVNAAGDQSSRPSGFTGGVQAGFNVQSGAMVAGIEAEFDYFGLKGSSSGSGIYPCCAPAGFTITSSVKTDWLATIRGRLGVASGSWLFYVTGGVAFTELKGAFTFTDNCGLVVACAFPPFAPVVEALSISKTKAGYVVGGGVEAGLWSNWSFRAEYLYVDFGSVSAVGFISSPAEIASIGIFNPFTHSIDLKAHIARLAINYRFGGAVVAAY